MSKPRIRFIDGKWWCGVPCSKTHTLRVWDWTRGEDTPYEAYYHYCEYRVMEERRRKYYLKGDMSDEALVRHYNLATSESRDYAAMRTSKFLWLPKKVEGKWRWLCSVTAYMRKVKRTSLAPEGIGSFEYEDWIVQEYKL